MKEDLSRLSSSDIRRFEKAVSDAKAVQARQEEIAKQVLAAEKEIGKVRLASLNEYLDTYSKGLDEIIARKTSQLNDAFLIMEQRALESFKKSAEEAEKTSAANKQQKNKKPKVTPTKRTDSSDNNNATNAPSRDNEQSNKKASSKKTAQKSGKGSGGGNKKPPNNKSTTQPANGDIEAYSTQSDEATNELGDAATAAAKNIVERLSDFRKKTSEEQLNDLSNDEDAINSLIQLEDLRKQKRKEYDKAYEESEKKLAKSYTELMLSKSQADRESADAQEFRLNKIKDLQISNIQEITEAELGAQQLLNDIEAERFAYTKSDKAYEFAELQAQRVTQQENLKSIQQTREAQEKYIAQEELKAKQKNGGILKAEDVKRIRQEADLKFKFDTDSLKKITALRNKEEKKERKQKEKDDQKTRRQTVDNAVTAPLSKDNNLKDRLLQTLKEESTIKKEDGSTNVGASIVKGLDVALSAISTMAKTLEKKIDEIALSKGAIDTRLQGSKNTTYKDSYWDQIVKDMTAVGAINPYFKQEDFANNIKSLVDQGIAFDLEQRAFLATISNKIATTFEVADGTLLRLIRIQQQDTTAGRLGMESALNAFLNNMYESTEYLKTVADSVRTSLTEMESLMEGAEAAEVEFQVQKWLGSLYSVGMSDTAVNSISQTLGQIASGQIEGLTNGGAGNLLIMAANEAGLSIADILTEGIDAKKTNDLMQAVVKYLAEIAESTKDNNVVQQQLADVFGVKASDLRAATNLTVQDSIGATYSQSMTYDNMLGRLFTMAGSMGQRTSMGEMMTNIWNNLQYSMAGGMASNPVTYGIYKMATLLDDTVGGIPIPDISVFGNAVALNTTVADLMRVGSMAGGIIGSLGDLVSGISNSFSGQAMLSQLGIKSGVGIEITPRGDGSNLLNSGGGSSSTSGSGYVGNASSSDIKDATMQEATDTKKQLMVEAQEEEEANQINVLNSTVLKIYELLDDVAHGSGYFRVKVENYGLTKAGSNSAQGGVSALGAIGSSSIGSSSGGISSGSGSGLSGGGVNSGGVSGSIDFGGWTTTL